MVINKCHIKEGIVFAIHNIKDGKETYLDEETEERQYPSAYEHYAEGKFKIPEYRRMKISLDRLNRTLVLLENSWQQTERRLSRTELENLLNRVHEIEKETEGIEDVFLREYIYGQLDVIAATRRYLLEEVRWDIESDKRIQDIL